MPGTGERATLPELVRRRSRVTLDALESAVAGLGTAVLALAALLLALLALITSLVGVGLLAVPLAARAVRAAADRERARLSRQGPEVPPLGPPPRRGARATVTDPQFFRELAWSAQHGTLGLALGLVAITLPLNVVRDGTFPLWWQLVPPEAATASIGWWVVDDLAGALGVALIGLLWIPVTMLVAPLLAELQSWPGRRLLVPDHDDLVLRVAELTATRAAALDAHASELRRIERSLHDGAQNRLLAVTVLLGVARRAVDRDPATAAAPLERAQEAAEQALAELRGVVHGIVPPVLAQRSLVEALEALAAASPVPCAFEALDPGRCAVSVEATVYFVTAEALTNIARHSDAARCALRLSREGPRLHLVVRDDGVGGADEAGGSGIAGIRQRVAVHGGTVALTSPPGGPTVLEVQLPCRS